MTRLLPAVCALLLAGAAEAHTRSASYSQWVLADEDGATRATMSVRVAQLDLSRLELDPRHTPDYAQAVAARVVSDLRLHHAGGVCTARDVSAQAERDGWVVVRASQHCDGAAQRLHSRLFETVAPSHLHFARVTGADGTVSSSVLGFADPVMPLHDAPAAPRSLLRYLGIGIEHILTGLDHLAFVVMLILLATRLRDVVWLASAFTVAHSLTLAAAVLGAVHVNAAWVEALIGLSIVLVAAENLWLRAGRDPWIPRLTWLALLAFSLVAWRWLPPALLVSLLLFTACYFALLARSARPLRLRLVLAFGFGLVHGFGFAGELLALELPAELLLTALAGFNVGVEIGQLLVIALIWPLLRWLRAGTPGGEWLRHGMTTVTLALGTFWWVARLAA